MTIKNELAVTTLTYWLMGHLGPLPLLCWMLGNAGSIFPLWFTFWLTHNWAELRSTYFRNVWSVGVWGKMYKIKICNCAVLVCKCTFKEKFHYTQMDIILVLVFQFVWRFPWPLTIYFFWQNNLCLCSKHLYLIVTIVIFWWIIITHQRAEKCL